MANIDVIEEKDYMGEFRREDVFAFCNVEYEEWYTPCSRKCKIAGKVEAYYAGYRAFVWPAFFFRSLWFVYRGMLKTAIILEVIELVCYGILVLIMTSDNRQLALGGAVIYLVSLLIYSLCLGFWGAECYGNYIRECLTDRKLERRENIPCVELKESLKKQGKPSWKRTIGYFLIVNHVVYFIFNAVVFTIRNFF